MVVVGGGRKPDSPPKTKFSRAPPKKPRNHFSTINKIVRTKPPKGDKPSGPPPSLLRTSSNGLSLRYPRDPPSANTKGDYRKKASAPLSSRYYFIVVKVLPSGDIKITVDSTLAKIVRPSGLYSEADIGGYYEYPSRYSNTAEIKYANYSGAYRPISDTYEVRVVVKEEIIVKVSSKRIPILALSEIRRLYRKGLVTSLAIQTRSRILEDNNLLAILEEYTESTIIPRITKVEDNLEKEFYNTLEYSDTTKAETNTHTTTLSQ
ncbi:uncharacterized protein N7500_008069 [Penicillium coprophilum]|uniref:uncharacterized protein n=1 Tax=Penicillium coprophilum TaxID=36646 RepID=UPI0023A4C6AC|nr:uncharacterized protein N7500_008069 [Penicillium coprophilum]KAJ5158418.1 hypothetical protein N7500_008069 [Penicillium coprophilum]